jgi:hypothetical protein
MPASHLELTAASKSENKEKKEKKKKKPQENSKAPISSHPIHCTQTKLQTRKWFRAMDEIGGLFLFFHGSAAAGINLVFV